MSTNRRTTALKSHRRWYCEHNLSAVCFSTRKSIVFRFMCDVCVYVCSCSFIWMALRLCRFVCSYSNFFSLHFAPFFIITFAHNWFRTISSQTMFTIHSSKPGIYFPFRIFFLSFSPNFFSPWCGWLVYLCAATPDRPVWIEFVFMPIFEQFVT